MNSIRAKMLLGFGLLLALLLSAMGAIFYERVRETLVDLTHGLSQEVLAARSAGLGTLFRGYQNDLRTLARDALFTSGDMDAIALALQRRFADATSDYEMLFFADKTGRWVSSIGASGNVADRAYFLAIMQDGVAEVVSEPVVSRATGATVFVVAAAVKDDAGRHLGLVAATVMMDRLSEIAGTIGIGDRGFGWVMDHQGLLIAHPNPDLRMTLNLFDSAALGYEGLEEIARTLARGEAGLSPYRRPDGTRFMTLYTPIPNTPHWGLGVSMPESELMGPVNDLMRTLMSLMGLLLGAMLVLVIVVSGRIAAPVRALMRGVEFVSAGHLEHRLDVRTGDEIQALAESFNRMTRDLKAHIENLARVTAEKARVDGELRAANQIQASMLPHLFPPYPDVANLDLYATMEPAKEVGGDFYDFYMLDARRFCFCIGDVSGKGVPAALFMVIGMTILRNLVRQGLPLERVFADANDMLCSDNGMFITTFMGILDTSTGVLEYVCAGHNPPLLASPGQACRYLEVPRNLFLGGLEGQGYQARRLILQPGDRLFLYTDGLTEAMNERGEFFGDERMIQAMDALSDRDVHGTLRGMREVVEGFVQDAPAADDLTMLVLAMNANG